MVTLDYHARIPFMKKTAYTLIDLSPHEGRILASLSLPGTLAQISKRLSLPRSTVEYTLKKLLEKKLISVNLKGKRKCYCLTQEKLEASLLPSSPIMRLGPITVYTGRRAIETLWQEVVKEPRESRLFGIQPHRSFKEAIKRSSKEIVVNVSQAITDKRFIMDAIIHEDMARSIFTRYEQQEAKAVAKVFTNRLENNVKVDPDFFDEKAEMFVIGDFSFFIDWFSEVAVKIENNNINHLLISLQQAAKAYGKRYEQGKYIESLIDER